MASNKNTQNVTKYEATLVKALKAAVNVGLCSKNKGTQQGIYDDLCAAAYYFVERVVLNKYRQVLKAYGIDPEEVANLVAEELFVRKLDYIMNSVNPVNCRGLINNTVKFRVRDSINSAKRAQNEVPVIVPDGNENSGHATDTTYSMANLHFTDVGWNLVSSKADLEQETIIRDEALSILERLKQNSHIFDVVSLLSTKVLGYKAGELAAELLEHGAENVYASVFREVEDLFGLDYEYFSNVYDLRETGLKHSELKLLSAEVSRGSDRAKNKVRKTLSR